MIFLNILAMLVCEPVSEIRCVVVPYKKGQSSLPWNSWHYHIIQHLKLQLSCPPSICNITLCLKTGTFHHLFNQEQHLLSLQAEVESYKFYVD